MILHVKGSNKAIRKLVESATRFYAEKLMGKRLTENLKITVNLKRNLLSKEGLEGSAVWEDDSYRPREFIVEIDSTVKVRNILLTLAHEMVHVKQWAKDEMYEYLNTIGMVRFKGEKVHLDSLEYWDQPWEIEAYGKQLGLFIRYCEYMNFEREDMKEDA
mgnify:FL=1|jgi:hypothetical protein|tara:strand:+ start:489 stop:968 length:480 start_codon:yes stop_codon:yes gene_type:complete